MGQQLIGILVALDQQSAKLSEVQSPLRNYFRIGFQSEGGVIHFRKVELTPY